jgi:hypothetical protein
MDLALQLSADQWELIQRRVKERIASPRIVSQNNVQHRHKEEEQRKYAQECREGQIGHQRPCVIVAEFLHHAEDQGGRTEALLGDVNATHHLLEWIHGSAITLFSGSFRLPGVGGLQPKDASRGQSFRLSAWA